MILRVENSWKIHGKILYFPGVKILFANGISDSVTVNSNETVLWLQSFSECCVQCTWR